MTRIIIDDVDSRGALIAAVACLLQTLNQPGALEVEEHYFCADQDTRTEPSADRSTEEPVKALVPCAQRGTHQRLTDCWLCWSDVMRGAALEPEVLARSAWVQ